MLPLHRGGTWTAGWTTGESMNNHPITSLRGQRLRPLALCLALALAPAAVQDINAADQSRAQQVRQAAQRLAFTPAPQLTQMLEHKRARGVALAAARRDAAAGTQPAQPMATLTVGHCLDDGSADSFREVVAAAVDGDVVDLTALSCSTITLASGGVGVTADNLTIRGPGMDQLAIDGDAAGTVLGHYGAGLLTIEDLTIANGDYFFAGACIWSGADLHLERTRVSNCRSENYANGAGIFSEGNITLVDGELIDNEASSDKYAVYGGGAFSLGDISVTGSTVANNVASSSAELAIGGGLFAVGNLSITNSHISGNSAVVGDDAASYGYSAAAGGASAVGSVTIAGTTFAGNSADLGGALALIGPAATLINSTVSGNSALVGGGILAQGADLSVNLANSTVASNAAMYYSGGIEVYGSTISLQSTILANNSAGNPVGQDLYLYGGVLGASANNLVVSSSAALPAETISSDPQLLPLAANGGPVPTHALASGSPAIDAGNNAAGLAFDQRGSGFARVAGDAADIGAFELQGAPPAPPPTAALAVPSASVWSLAMLAGLLGVFGWRSGRLAPRVRK